MPHRATTDRRDRADRRGADFCESRELYCAISAYIANPGHGAYNDNGVKVKRLQGNGPGKPPFDPDIMILEQKHVFVKKEEKR